MLFESSLRTNVLWPAGHYLHQYSHSFWEYGKRYMRESIGNKEYELMQKERTINNNDG
jgi:hypothetical protein